MLRIALTIVLASLTLTGARADGACPRGLSPAQLEKLLAYVRSDVGTSATFYAPLPFDFGWTDDPHANLAGREVATDDRVESFARSEAHPDDFIITELRGDEAWLFATHPDFCLARAFVRRHGGPPEALDVRSPAVQARYASALRAWAADLDHSPPPPVTPSIGSPPTRASTGR